METIDTVKDSFDVKDVTISAQKATILKQTKRVLELEAEIKELKKAPKSVSLVSSESNPINLNVSDEEAICLLQLKDLKTMALERELTLEETKKVEIFVKCLNVIRNKPKKVEVNGKDLSNDQLIGMLDKALAEG